MKQTFVWVVVAAALLSACQQKPSDSRYSAGEVATSRAVEYGTVIALRDVDIMATTKEEEVGTLLGAGVGAGGGSYVGDGSGSNWATAGGVIAGAVIGDMIAKEMMNSTGVEYTLQMRSGETKMIVQEKNKDHHLFKVGDKAMLQYCDGGNVHVKRCAAGADFQRLLPVSSFPPEMQKKKKSRKRKTRDVPDDFYDTPQTN